MKSSLLIASSIFLALPNGAFAYSDEMRQCFSTLMDIGIERRLVIVAGSVATFCACTTNRIKQDLSPLDCPRWRSLKEDEYNKYFGPN